MIKVRISSLAVPNWRSNIKVSPEVGNAWSFEALTKNPSEYPYKTAFLVPILAFIEEEKTPDHYKVSGKPWVVMLLLAERDGVLKRIAMPVEYIESFADIETTVLTVRVG
jgi:hypothetical protein